MKDSDIDQLEYLTRYAHDETDRQLREREGERGGGEGKDGRERGRERKGETGGAPPWTLETCVQISRWLCHTW